MFYIYIHNGSASKARDCSAANVLVSIPDVSTADAAADSSAPSDTNSTACPFTTGAFASLGSNSGFIPGFIHLQSVLDGDGASAVLDRHGSVALNC